MNEPGHRKYGAESYLRVVLLLLRIVLTLGIIIVLVLQHLG